MGIFININIKLGISVESMLCISVIGEMWEEGCICIWDIPPEPSLLSSTPRNLLLEAHCRRFIFFNCCSVTQSCPTLCNPMDCSPPGSPVTSLSPGVCSDSCSLSWWYYLTILSSATSFSVCLQSFWASGSFPMSWLFHQVAKVWELQLQHQFFQWIFRVDFF